MAPTVLRDPNVRRVVLARFISRSGAFAAFFVGMWGKAAFTFDATAGELAAMMGALGVASVIGTVASGVLVDRFDPRRVLMWAEVAFVPATLIMAATNSMTQLIGAAGFLGLAGAPILTAVGAFTPFLASDEGEIRRINVSMETAGMASLTAGTALGAVIERVGSVDWVFVFDAATSLVAIALVAGVEVRPVEAPGGRSAWREALGGLGYTYRTRALRFYILMGTALFLTFGAFGALEPLFFRDVVGAESPEVLGWVNAVFGLGLIAGALSVPRLPDEATSARGLGVIVALNGAGVVLYVGTGNLAVVLTGAVVWGLILGALAPILRSLVHLASPEGMYGRISGVLELHSQGGELLPLLFVAPLAAAFGVQQVLLAGGVLLTLAALAGLAEARQIDRALVVRAGPEAPVEPAWPHP